LANFNKVILIGNVTRDIEMAYLPNNTPVAKLGIATNRKFKRQNGEEGEEVCFIDCKAFGRSAEILNQYVQKGHSIMLEGRLTLEQWDDKATGAKRSKHTVMIENFQFLNNKQDGERQQRNDPQERNTAPNNDTPAPPPAMGDDSDIPFAPDCPY
jgi:single-strand DNA-binding protein